MDKPYYDLGTALTSGPPHSTTVDPGQRLTVQQTFESCADDLEAAVNIQSKDARQRLDDLEAAQARVSELQTQLAAVTAERDEARAIVANVNNSVIGSQGYFTKPDCVEAIEKLKAYSNRHWNEREAAQASADRLEQQLAHEVESLRICSQGQQLILDNLNTEVHRRQLVEAQLATLTAKLNVLPCIAMVSAKTHDEPQRIYVYIPKAELDAILAASEPQIDKKLIRSEDDPVNQFASLKDKLKFLKRSRAWLLGARCDVIEADDLDAILESISVTEETEP